MQVHRPRDGASLASEPLALDAPTTALSESPQTTFWPYRSSRNSSTSLDGCPPPQILSKLYSAATAQNLAIAFLNDDRRLPFRTVAL